MITVITTTSSRIEKPRSRVVASLVASREGAARDKFALFGLRYVVIFQNSLLDSNFNGYTNMVHEE